MRVSMKIYEYNLFIAERPLTLVREAQPLYYARMYMRGWKWEVRTTHINLSETTLICWCQHWFEWLCRPIVQDDHTQQVVRNIQVCRIHCALFQIAKPTVVMVIIAHQTKCWLWLKRDVISMRVCSSFCAWRFGNALICHIAQLPLPNVDSSWNVTNKNTYKLS